MPPASDRTTPAVDLLIPCFNAAAFLPQLVKSIDAQTVRFSSVLCYDDGSTDDTVSVARALGLSIVSGHPNRGVAHARNQLAARAEAEWIHFQDADDPLLPQFLERLLPFCSGQTDVVSCDADWLDARTRELQLTWRYDPEALANDPAPHLLARPMSLHNTLIRLSSWGQVGGCNEALAIWEDADLHFRLALSGARFRHLSEVLSLSLRRPESFSHDYVRNWRCRLQSLESYGAAALNPPTLRQLASEAERAAAALLRLNDEVAARRAIRLCARLGHRVPTTGNRVFRGVCRLLPPWTALRLQAWIRRSVPARLPFP